MTVKFRFLLPLLLLCTVFSLCSLPASAEESAFNYTLQTADGGSAASLTDDSYATYTSVVGNLTLKGSAQMQGIYIMFDRIPTPWTLTDESTGESVTCGNNGFLHEYIDLTALFSHTSDRYILSFPEGTVIADIYAFGHGTLPEWVQRWNPPCEQVDLLLFSSHADDEQLFFAGLLPLYAGELGYKVQVAYMVNHFEAYGAPDHQRPHEQLNGLWAVGVTNYPVMSDFPDVYSESLEGARSVFASSGVTEEDFVNYLISTIRRFQPLVVVSHDPNGEYGHGTHILTVHALKQALTRVGDPTQHSESAATYGTWVPEKVYLHLYGENTIAMNYDLPLEHFGGKTAFEMTQYGFSFHKSQHWTWFYDWIYGSTGAPITKATQINGYSPCFYGLYFTTVGYDVMGGDMFENVKSHEVREAEQAAAETTDSETAPVETVPSVTETHAAETVPPHTTEIETKSPLTTPTEQDSKSPLPFLLTGILVIGVIMVVVIYTVTLQKLNRKKRNKKSR